MDRKKKIGPFKRKAVEKSLARIRALASALSLSDDIPEALFKEVSWLIEEGHAERIMQLTEEEDLTHSAAEVINFVIRESGYRLIVVKNSDEIGEEEVGEDDVGEDDVELIVIPIAIIVIMLDSVQRARQFPEVLPETTRALGEGGLLARAFDLPDGTKLIIDSRVYRPERDEWQDVDSARRYQKSFADLAMGLSGDLDPFISESSNESDLFDTLEDYADSEEVIPSHRIICGAAIARSGEQVVLIEELLFHFDPEKEHADRLSFIADLIRTEADLPESGGDPKLFVLSRPVELWQVPEVVLSNYRYFDTASSIMQARNKLLVMAQPGRAIQPVMYVSYHGPEGADIFEAEELRLAAYVHGIKGEEPFFTYVWKVIPELEPYEVVSHAVHEIARDLNAQVHIISELKIDERCSCCGERIFYGPSGRVSIH